MAPPTTPTERTFIGVPPPTHSRTPREVRYASPWNDGHGRIRYGRPPYTCKIWTLTDPIPFGWFDFRQPFTITAASACDVHFIPNARQAAAITIDRSSTVAASRLPRLSRQARTPRPVKLPRAPRQPRPPRPPRAARKPRVPRNIQPTPRPAPPAKKQPGFWCQNPHVWPLAWRARDTPCGPGEIEGCEVIEIHQGKEWHSIQPCEGSATSKCSSQAAAFIRPLQQLLGWTRPTLPTREQLAARPKPTPTRAQPPTQPTPPSPPTPPPITYIVPARVTCLKNGAFNLVDCYSADNFGNPIDLFWSNHIDGPWRGEPAPPQAPPGAGIGYKVS